MEKVDAAGISVLVPLHLTESTGPRVKSWNWLKQYWEAIPGLELVIGDDKSAGRDHLSFSKSIAVNDAASRASGDIFAILDADAYLPIQAIIDCAHEIRLAKENNWKLWFIPFRQLFRMTEEASNRVLNSDPENPPVISTPPPEADFVNKALFGGPKGMFSETEVWRIGHWYGAMAQIMSREAFDTVGGWDGRFCVDEETQIFTNKGWKYRHELGIGDIALTLNHDTGMSEWQPVKAINVFYGQHEMLSIESKTHSSLTTMNHKWPTIRRPDYRAKTGWGSKKETREWSTSDSFTCESQVPIAADHADLPLTETYTDALVECVAWFWTEGSISRLRNGTRGRNVSMSQSFVVNLAKCERIRSALTSAFGKPTKFPRRGASLKADIPRWREYPDRRNIVFCLNAEAGSIMQLHAPNRVPSHEFLLSLTKPQLDLFIESSLLGDGNWRKGSYEIKLGQKNKAASEAFQFACILAGHCTSIVTDKNKKGYDYGLTQVSIRQQKRFKLCKGKHLIITLEGVVWCPTTENKTWMARRNGKVYFTGNSGWGGEDHAAMAAMNTLYGPHKTLPGAIFHLWHPVINPEVIDVHNTGKKRMWEGQTSPNANDALSGRYYWANGNVKRMRQLVDEFKNNKEVKPSKPRAIPPGAMNS